MNVSSQTHMSIIDVRIILNLCNDSPLRLHIVFIAALNAKASCLFSYILGKFVNFRIEKYVSIDKSQECIAYSNLYFVNTYQPLLRPLQVVPFGKTPSEFANILLSTNDDPRIFTILQRAIPTFDTPGNDI